MILKMPDGSQRETTFEEAQKIFARAPKGGTQIRGGFALVRAALHRIANTMTVFGTPMKKLAVSLEIGEAISGINSSRIRQNRGVTTP
jgi:hypothetical protein